MSKTVIITGAAKGIGKGIAIKLASLNYNLVLADNDLEELEKTANEMTSSNIKVEYLQTDVSKREQVKKLVKYAIDKFGSLEALVNNAGIYPFKFFLELTDEDWDKVLNINLKSVFMLSQEALKVLPENGRIVNISSIASQVGFEGLTHYCASKGAINAFTRALALETANKKITVNAIAPGSIETPGATSANMTEDARKQLESMIPLKHSGKASDIANGVAFLLSDEASYITGQIITIDGGWTLR